jgi:Protein of unknown function (DUF3303)
MLYMVIERFKNRDAVPVYRRFRDEGRLSPDGLSYVSSWIDENFQICFQIMETEEPELLDQWMGRWSDLVDFEVFPIITSVVAFERISPHLSERHST